MEMKSLFSEFSKQLVKSYLPIAKEYLAAKESLDKKKFEEKIENSFKLAFELVYKNFQYQNTSISRMKDEILNEIKFLKPGINSTSNQLKKIIELDEALQKELQNGLINKLKLQKIDFQESEILIEFVDEKLFEQILFSLPEAFTIPTYAANLIDLLVEVYAHHKIGLGSKEEVTKIMRKCELLIKKQNLPTQVQNYESLGALGLTFENPEYFEKHIDKYKSYDGSYNRQVFQNTSWWSASHYNYSLDSMESEYVKISENKNYSQIKYYTAQMLSSYHFNSVHEGIELFDLDDNIDLKKKLQKISFK